MAESRDHTNPFYYTNHGLHYVVMRQPKRRLAGMADSEVLLLTYLLTMMMIKEYNVTYSAHMSAMTVQ